MEPSKDGLQYLLTLYALERNDFQSRAALQFAVAGIAITYIGTTSTIVILRGINAGFVAALPVVPLGLFAFLALSIADGSKRRLKLLALERQITATLTSLRLPWIPPSQINESQDIWVPNIRNKKTRFLACLSVLTYVTIAGTFVAFVVACLARNNSSWLVDATELLPYAFVFTMCLAVIFTAATAVVRSPVAQDTSNGLENSDANNLAP